MARVFRTRQPTKMVIVHRSKNKDIEKNLRVRQTGESMISEKGVKERRNGVVRPLVGGLVAIFFIAAAFLGISQKASPTRLILTPPHVTNEERIPANSILLQDTTPPKVPSYTERLRHPRVVALQNCTVSFNAPANMSFPPIWMPSFPGSGAASASKKGDLVKPIVDKLTGWVSGSKNYHMSIKNKLKRCHAVNSPTAVCTNGHPMTTVGPQKQTSNFNQKVIMVVRNFYTAYPAFMQDKAFAYHGAKDQVPEQEWRSNRDDWSKSSFETWKNFFVEWKGMDYYEIGMYIQYEKIMDPEKGIAVVERLADQLRQAGLEIAPAAQIPCIWYQAVEPEYRRLEHFYKYEPAYTPEQKEHFTLGVEKFIQEMADPDEELILILKEYLDEMKSNVKVDA